jgi:polyhydroxyalkanoate synthesis regulator phasin
LTLDEIRSRNAPYPIWRHDDTAWLIARVEELETQLKDLKAINESQKTILHIDDRLITSMIAAGNGIAKYLPDQYSALADEWHNVVGKKHLDA